MSQTLLVMLIIAILVLILSWIFCRYGMNSLCNRCAIDDTPQPLKSEESSDTVQTEEPEQSKPDTMEEPKGTADDLKKISGVGPKIEQTLNGLGIFHYQQIADFTVENIEWVDNNLNFKGRIQRDNWVEQAKELAQKS